MVEESEKDRRNSFKKFHGINSFLLELRMNQAEEGNKDQEITFSYFFPLLEILTILISCKKIFWKECRNNFYSKGEKTPRCFLLKLTIKEIAG